MKRFLSVASLVILFALGLAFAQDIGTLLGELLGTEWSAIFAETAVFGGLIGLLVKLVNTLRPDTIVGSAKYFAAVVIGLAGGVVFDVLGLITAATVSDLPTPMAGLTFGLQSALVAVGIHQGVKQTGEAFRKTSTTRLR